MIKPLEASNFVFFCALLKEHGIVKMSACFYVMLMWTMYFEGKKTRQSDNTFVVATTFSSFLFYFYISSPLFLKSLCYLFHLIVNKCKFQYINHQQSKWFMYFMFLVWQCAVNIILVSKFHVTKKFINYHEFNTKILLLYNLIVKPFKCQSSPLAQLGKLC